SSVRREAFVVEVLSAICAFKLHNVSTWIHLLDLAGTPSSQVNFESVVCCYRLCCSSRIQCQRLTPAATFSAASTQSHAPAFAWQRAACGVARRIARKPAGRTARPRPLRASTNCAAEPPVPRGSGHRARGPDRGGPYD